MWRLGRFLVRNLWRHLELFGIKDPTSAAKNYHTKKDTEIRIITWSNKFKQMIIAGHTHRPVFPNKIEPCYFNTGACVFPRGITGIEIENGNITLIKWDIKVNKDGMLYVGKDIIEGPEPLTNYF
jgi:predicted phosphodiesterase